MQNIMSPESYIEMGFYFMISAALQRRVWVGDGNYRLFPNTYSIFCAPPAIGKGLVLGPVKACLKFYKFDELKNPRKLDKLVLREVDMGTEDDKKQEDKKLLFPVVADSITFEKLVNFNANCLSAIIYPKVDPVTGNRTEAIYTHSSMSIILPEMSSLFKRNSEAIVNYLINVYDSGEYEYATKNAGTDRVRRNCVSFLAATQPIFIQNSANDSLFDDGFFSRMLLIYEERNRFCKFGIPKFTDEQNQALVEIMQHLRLLSRVFGEVTWEPDALEYMRHYFEEVLPYKRVNPSPRLEHYYGRKNITATKLALAIQFSENTERVIRLPSVVRALDFLERVEVNMHKPFSTRGANPLAQVGSNVVRWMTQQGGSKSYSEIWSEFVGSLTSNQLNEVLGYLQTTGQVIHRDETRNFKKVTVFTVKPKSPGGATLTERKE